jgi:serine/threonine protein kinase
MSAAAATNRCPDRSELLAFISSRTAPTASHAIEAHVTSCNRCLEEIERMEEESDVVVRALAALPATADDEHEFRQLQGELLSSAPSATKSASGNYVSFRDRLPPKLKLPFQLGAYELIEEIGRGASGAVYRARHVKLDRIFAVKVLRADPDGDAPSSAPFTREMKAVGRLNHPHIVRATDAGEDRGYQYLVMEYAEGIDISAIVRRLGTLPIADACEIARQAALGLEHAHQHGLVHRDLKPSNLLLASSGQVKLLDLGLVGVSPDQTRVTEAPVERFPRGTADFMAPEQWSDFQNVDHRADLYSLGCTLFKMLTGVAPYQTLADGCDSKMRAHQAADIPRLGDRRQGAPPELNRVLARLLAKRPADRYQSVVELLVDLTPLAAGADLAALLHRLGLPHESLATAPSDAPRGRVAAPSKRISRRTILVGGAAAASLAAVYGRRLWHSVPSVQTSQWRPLAPAAPALLLSLDDGAKWSYTPSDQAISITGNQYTLVNLGRPLRGAFSVRTKLTIDSPGGRAGLFFRYREGVYDGVLTREFHVLELFADLESVAGRTMLQWSHLVTRQSSGDDQAARKLWASTVVDRADEGELQITVGLDGFPVMMWKGKPLAESHWKLTSEGRRKSQISRHRLATDYLGSLGVFASNGAAAFYRPELMYHELR